MENENRPPEKKELPDLSLDGPKGVGGWLAFLIIILTILSPVANIAMLAKDFHEIEMENPIMLHISAYVQYNKWFCWGSCHRRVRHQYRCRMSALEKTRVEIGPVYDQCVMADRPFFHCFGRIVFLHEFRDRHDRRVHKRYVGTLHEIHILGRCLDRLSSQIETRQ